MLDVSGISRHYGDFKAVDNASFSIGSGEIVGLLGPNGAGKTTIMKMLSGYLEPDEGTVVVDGTDISTDLKSFQSTLGYLPESLPLYSEMSVIDYLDYAADLKRIKSAHKRAEITRVIDATELAIKLNDPIATLSRGYKQRTGVAQAILGSPKLLILDEPTNGLDPQQTDQMRQLLREIASDATVILSTHIMQEVEALCDRVLMLRSGELVIDESLQHLQRSNQMRVSCRGVSGLTEGLAGVSGVEQVQLVDTRFTGADTVLVTLNENSVVDGVAPALGRFVIDSGGELIELSEQKRDIETLFRKLNNINPGEAA